MAPQFEIVLGDNLYLVADAGVAQLVDAPACQSALSRSALEASASAGSSPATRTKHRKILMAKSISIFPQFDPTPAYVSLMDIEMYKVTELGWYLFDDNDVPVGGPLTSRDKAMATLKSKREKKKKHR
jgi:hypothetical protein